MRRMPRGEGDAARGGARRTAGLSYWNACGKPEGAYYVFPRIVTEHADSRSFALDLLDKAHVIVTPGAAFGPSGEHHVRMAYCVDDHVIDTAFDRMEQHFGQG